jgi:zinc protease
MRTRRMTWNRLAAAATLLMAFSLPLRAQKPPKLPDDLPAYGPLKPYVSPKVAASTLPNGMTLWLVPRPGYPKVTFALAVHGGLASDPQDLAGLSELLASSVTQGTTTRTAKQIAEQIGAAGGDLTSRADEDDIVVSVQVPSWKIQDGLALLADISQNAAFPEDQVALIKRNSAEELRGSESRSIFLARRALAKLIFGPNPYSVIAPTEEAIAKINSESLAQAYRSRFRPGQALFVAVGDFDAAQMMPLINRAFAGWQEPQQGAAPPIAAPQAQAHHEMFVVERPGSVQTTMLLGGIGPTERDPQYVPFQVSDTILGGMSSARLGSNIRENKGYSYGAGSLLQTYAGTALSYSGANVRNAVTGAAFNEFLYELNRMATTTARPDELERAQRHLVGSQALQLQSQVELTNQFCDLWSKGLPADTLEQQGAEILKVTLDDVTKISREYFPAYKQTIVMVGDKKVIADQVAPFGLQIEPAP